MPNNEEDFNNSPGFLRYKIEQIEKFVYPLAEVVNGLDKKVSLLAQKILIATLLIGGAFQVFGLWYGSHLSNQQNASESESNYEYRKQESRSIEELKREIELLKRNVK